MPLLCNSNFIAINMLGESNLTQDRCVADKSLYGFFFLKETEKTDGRCCKMMKSQKQAEQTVCFFSCFRQIGNLKKKKRTVLRNCPSTHAPFVCVPASLYVSVSVSVCLSQVTLNPPTSWTIKQRGVSLTHVLPTVAETQSEHKNHFTDCKGPPAHDHGTLQNHEQYTPLSWLLCPK